MTFLFTLALLLLVGIVNAQQSAFVYNSTCPFALSASVIEAFDRQVQDFFAQLSQAQRQQLSAIYTNTASTKAQLKAAFVSFAGQLSPALNQSAIALAQRFESLKADWLTKLQQISPDSGAQAVINSLIQLNANDSLTAFLACIQAQNLVKSMSVSQRAALNIPENEVEQWILPDGEGRTDCPIMGEMPLRDYFINVGQPDYSQSVLEAPVVTGLNGLSGNLDYPFAFRQQLDSGKIDLSKLTVEQRVDINRGMWNYSIAYMQHYSNLVITLNPNASWISQLRNSFNGTGKYKMLVLGNSHADMLSNELKDQWVDVYSQMDIFTIQGCLPFDIHYMPNDADRAIGEPCVVYAAAAMQLVQQIQPDIVFVQFYWDTMNVSSNWTLGVQPPLTYPIENDRVYQDFQRALDQIANTSSVKLIYFSAPNLDMPYPMSPELARRIWSGIDLKSTDLKLKDHLTRTHDNQMRLKALRCPKCVIMDWTKVYCDAQGSCQGYLPVGNLSYFIDQHHYTFLGARKVGPYLKELANNVKTEMLWHKYANVTQS